MIPSQEEQERNTALQVLHGIANGQPAEYYETLASGELANYQLRNRGDREGCYFLGMMLRLLRGIDVLTAQPQWDGRTVAVFGVSQGGFQAIAAAGLDPTRVTFFAAVRVVTFSFLCPLGLEKYGTFIARCNALIEKVSSFRECLLGATTPVT
eukprot:SAG31_NODE_369_length_16731_cov_36.453283_4_plen_153_part_00